MMPIKDGLNRSLDYLPISVTDRCNFRCTYCMPADKFGPDYAFMPSNKLLEFNEITRLVKIFSQLGVRKIRLTGGESLVRKDVEALVTMLVDYYKG